MNHIPIAFPACPAYGCARLRPRTMAISGAPDQAASRHPQPSSASSASGHWHSPSRGTACTWISTGVRHLDRPSIRGRRRPGREPPGRALAVKTADCPCTSPTSPRSSSPPQSGLGATWPISALGGAVAVRALRPRSRELSPCAARVWGRESESPTPRRNSARPSALFRPPHPPVDLGGSRRDQLVAAAFPATSLAWTCATRACRLFSPTARPNRRRRPPHLIRRNAPCSEPKAPAEEQAGRRPPHPGRNGRPGPLISPRAVSSATPPGRAGGRHGPTTSATARTREPGSRSRPEPAG